jgi:hypothetical protein
MAPSLAGGALPAVTTVASTPVFDMLGEGRAACRLKFFLVVAPTHVALAKRSVVKLAEIYTTMRNLGKNLPGKFDEPDSPDPEPVAGDNREFTFEEFLVEFAGCGFAK